ncbi:phage tail assembly chaperone [Escherichia coli]|uniref:phage tail assembly chaperone n=1 Tax=Escherichia coli TaxID=562 RepID=UPI0037DC9EF6
MTTTQVNKRIRTKEFEDGRKLTIQVLGAVEGITLARKLAKAFIPTFKEVIAPDGKIDIMEGMESLVAGLDEIELTKVIARLFDSATVNDFPLNVDDYFAANYGDLVDFLAFALMENFGSFFKTEIASQFVAGE